MSKLKHKTKSIKSRDILSVFSRVLVSGIFIGAGLSKLQKPEQTSQYMKSKNLPAVPVLRNVAASVEIAGGLGLLAGYRPRLAAGALIGFLIPTSIIFHNFWALEGQDREMQQVNFLKNLAIIGALIELIGHGPGKLAIHGESQQEGGTSPLLDKIKSEVPFFRAA